MKKISNVFYITIGLIILTVGYGALAPENFEAVTTNVKNFVASSFGWYYMLLMSFMLALSFYFHRQSIRKNPTWKRYGPSAVFNSYMGCHAVFCRDGNRPRLLWCR